MLEHLHADKLVATIETLEHRISERFPGSGLSRNAASLTKMGRDAARRSAAIRRPHIPLRLLTYTLVLGLIVLLVYVVTQVHFRLKSEDGWEMIQGIEASLSSLVFLGGALFFVITLERRVKRGRALDAIQQVRALAHVIDMHQLVKDPERSFRKPEENTPSSPKAALTPFLLGRYLDYCSELLSLMSKVSVLYGQDVDDEVVLRAVDDIEDLTGGLARRIWQKIMLLDSLEARAARAAEEDAREEERQGMKDHDTAKD
jgi:hypothetical protein